MRRTSLLAVLMFVMLIASGTANAAATCSNNTLKSQFGLLYHGDLGNGKDIVGVVYLNSTAGGQFVAGTTGQEAVTPASQTALTVGAGSTYSVSTGGTSCLVTLTLYLTGSSLPQPAHFDFFFNIPDNAGDGIESDGVPVNQIEVSARLVKRGAATTCTGASVAGNFIFSESGPWANVGGDTIGAGSLTLSAAGGVNGTESLFLAGAGLVPLVPVVGSFTINPDCTGAMTLDAAGGAFIYDNATMTVNSGKEILYIRSDAGWVLYGDMMR